MSGHPRARSEGIITEEMDEELVVYDETTKMAHALSKDAASVWRLCDGHSSVKDIARRVGLEDARVAQTLDELSGAELIEQPLRISRRALYKRAAKLGAAGAAAVSAPLIYSIALPPPSAAQSSLCPISDVGSACLLVFASTDCSGEAIADTCVRFADLCICHPGPDCIPNLPNPGESNRPGTCS